MNLAYFIYKKNGKPISEDEFQRFYEDYQNIYHAQGFKETKRTLLNCNLLRCTDDYYYKLAVPDLEDIVEELRDNPVAMSIIRARVRSYLYNNYVPFNDRQKIINTVNLSPKDSSIIANKLQNKYRK